MLAFLLKLLQILKIIRTSAVVVQEVTSAVENVAEAVKDAAQEVPAPNPSGHLSGHEEPEVKP